MNNVLGAVTGAVGGAVGGAVNMGKSGTPFDPVEFFKRPTVILRILAWVFAIIVFGCISAEGWVVSKVTGTVYCQFNGSEGACNFGTAIGVLAFMACIIFIVIEYQFDSMSNVKQRKMVTIADMAFSGLWTFLWFVCFCALANEWRMAQDDREKHVPLDFGRANVQSAIAFSFFSIPVWAALTFFGVQKYRAGVASNFGMPTDGFDEAGMPPAPDGMGVDQGGYAPYNEDPYAQQQQYGGGGGGGQYGQPQQPY